MTHYYEMPRIEGNVVHAVRDWEVESQSESQQKLLNYISRACSEDSLCSYIEGEYLMSKQDGFKKHPELKQGIELRCENREEAEYLSQVVDRRLQGVTPVKITYY